MDVSNLQRIPYSSINLGAIGSGAYYFNRYIGGEVIYTNHPSGVNDGMSGVSGGLIARLPMENFTLFAHGLVGVARLGGPNSEVPATFEHEPYRWGPALTVGGGMDYDLPFFSNRFSLRLFQADYRYMHEDYGPSQSIPTGGILGGRTNMDAVELSTGIVTHFGHIIPPPPVTYSCSVAPDSVYPGDPITVTGTAMNLNPKKTPTYTWTSTGGAISGSSSTANIDTKTAAPGTYTVTGHVTEGPKPGQSADCTGAVHGQALRSADDVSCTANPSTVDSGGSVDDYSERSEPAESSSDLQLQRDGWIGKWYDLYGDADGAECSCRRQFFGHCYLQCGGRLGQERLQDGDGHCERSADSAASACADGFEPMLGELRA